MRDWGKSKVLLVVFSFFIIYQLIGIYNIQSSPYHGTFYMNNTGGSPEEPLNPSFRTLQFAECEIELHGRATFTNAGAFTATTSFFSPNETLIASGTQNLANNVNCVSLGTTGTSNTLDDNFESYLSVTHTATTGIGYLESTLRCDVAGDFVNFTSSPTLQDDDGNVVNLYVSYLAQNPYYTVQAMADRLNDTNFGRCEDVLVDVFSPSAVIPAVDHYTAMFYYPFNSSTSGVLYYDLDGTGTVTGGTTVLGGEDWYIYPLSNSNALTGLCAGADPCEGSIALDPDTAYVLVYYVQINSQVGNPTLNTPDVNYSLSVYLPDWDCTDWSDCESGSQFRQCTDPAGKIADQIEYRACYSAPDRSYVMGFENSTAEVVFYSYPEWWVVGCPFFLGYKYERYPSDGWEVNNISNPRVYDNGTHNIWGYTADTLEVADYESVDGTHSLKMWNLPPEQYLPACVEPYFTIENQTCEVTPYGNYTYTQVPRINKDINETYLLSRNITFDYPNMTVSMYIKKCAEPVQEWAGNTSFGGLCGDGYYTSDKNSNHDIEDTRVFLYIYDYNLSTGISYVRFIANSEEWQRKELRLENMSTTHLYRFMIGLEPESYTDTDNYCAFIDQLELNAYSGTVPCISRCEGVTRFQARPIGEFGCVYDVIEVSDICVDEEYIDEVDSCVTHCDCEEDSTNYLTYLVGSNSTGQCEWTLEVNSDYCASYCPTLITDSVSDTIQTRLDNAGVGFLGNFLTPMFIILCIIIGIAGFVAYKLDKSWQIFTVLMIIELLIISVLWIEFSFIGILIAVVLAIFLAKMNSSGGN